MAAPLELTNAERGEIISFLQEETILHDVPTESNEKHLFKGPEDLYTMKIVFSSKSKRAPIHFLSFFTVEDISGKKDFITYFHTLNGHPGRDKLYSSFKRIAYGIKVPDCLKVTSRREVCCARRTLVTRPVITPIVSRYPRERLIIDMVDLRMYEEDNDDYKWLLVMVDSFTKYAWCSKTKSKRADEVVPEIRKVVMSLG